MRINRNTDLKFLVIIDHLVADIIARSKNAL